MTHREFSERLGPIRARLYKTALLYLKSEALALDAVDEAVYKGLKGCKKLRQPEYFTTWLTRILINQCKDELLRQRRYVPLEAMPEQAAEEFDRLPLQDAIHRLPKDMRDLVILHYFAGYTLAECAGMLDIPQGTAATRHRRALELLRLELREEEDL